ncbi:hypothetical protein [Rossellomorea vietnamensis]|uniref:hypothetical protein n=1 Tax=Rossellomorea vietnamensis TaxID=218284 RepID=UPI001653A9CB|nr:hypothetical protein [Rossellomorea vietnamensis]
MNKAFLFTHFGAILAWGIFSLYIGEFQVTSLAFLVIGVQLGFSVGKRQGVSRNSSL